jgi:apolipoprotein N-acyltransferase
MAIVWFWDVLPLDWVDTTFLKSVTYVGFSWGLATFMFALFFALFAALFVRYRTKSSLDAVLAASLWTVLQYAQLWGFAVVTTRDFSLAGAHFSPTFVGYALADFSPLLQLAAIGGVYLLTFVLVAFAFLLAHVVCSVTMPRMRLYGAAFTLGCIAIFALDHVHPFVRAKENEAPSRRLALVTTYFAVKSPRTTDEQMERARITEDVLRDWAHANPVPDIVVLPEANDFFVLSGREPRTFSEELFGRRVAFVDSGPQKDGTGERYVQMRFYEAGATDPLTHGKAFLVPQGEYSIWLFVKLLDLIGVSQEERRVLAERTIVPGADAFVASVAGARVAALFCTEVLSPTLFRSLAEEGAELFLNPASQTWFHGSRVVEHMTNTHAKVRAVENGRYTVMVGNDVPSVVFSHRGDVIARSARETSVMDAVVPLRTNRTPYTHFGELVLFVPFVVVLLLVARRMKDGGTTNL